MVRSKTSSIGAFLRTIPSGSSVNRTELTGVMMAGEKAQKMKKALIEAAYDVLRQDGIDSLTLDRVAAQAQASKGALTYHFRTKRDLHRAMIQHYIEHMDEEMKKYVGLFEGDEADVLAAGYIEWFKAFETNNRGWAQVGLALLSHFAGDDEMIEPMREWYRKLFSRISALPEPRRTPILVCVMTLEGFFYAHKFGLNFVAADLKKQLWPFLEKEVAKIRVKRKPYTVEY